MSSERHLVQLPSEVPGDLGPFDRFAGWAASVAARAPFFAFCLLLVTVWLIQGVVTLVLTRDASRFLDDTYQLEINTTTTIITFLMVALLQNASTRSDKATQHKLNAVAEGLADLMEHVAEQFPGDDLECDIDELRAAVGLEAREGTRKPKRVASGSSG
jgi:low affinity Fe/Cu permease